MVPVNRNRRPEKRPGPRKKPPATGSGPSITLEIEGLAHGGDGVGRVDGKVLFAPLTAPGDLASVEVLSDRRSFLRGRLVELSRPSPLRTDPRCSLFGECGGCHWQHISYEAQLSAKGQVVLESLRRIGRIAEIPEVLEVIPSPLRYGYRHRCRLQVRRRSGATVLGFARAGSHDVVDLEHCPVLAEGLNTLLPLLSRRIREEAALFRRPFAVSLSLDFPGTRARLSLHHPDGSLVLPPEFAGAFSGEASALGIDITFPGPREKGLSLGPSRRDLISTGDSFTQVNLRQNRRLVEEVLELARPVEGERVLDLFCGIGNFSIPLAFAGTEVLGVDLNGPSIRCARANAERLGVRLRFRRADAPGTVVSLAASGERFDLAVVNPPRSGSRDLVEELPSLRPPRIVMVSCDPATFARDASILTAGGYRLEVLRAIDLFPQTFHVETIALFSLR
jgi:23S rRNA (uracil1939-C5)-methyltransferase